MDNWKDSQQEDMQTIDIHLTRGVVMALGCVLLVATVLGYLVWSERDVAASGAQRSISIQSSVPAKYYVTSSTLVASQAMTACATGYHMASFWEIIDVSNLEYNGTLGYTRSDSGSGPPTGAYGWVRTGSDSDTSAMSGRGNCSAWTSGLDVDSGTRVQLPVDWTGAADLTAPWEAATVACSNPNTHVWCMED